MPDDVLPWESVSIGDHAEGCPAFCVFTLEEIGGQDSSPSLLQSPAAEPAGGLGDVGEGLLPGISGSIAQSQEIRSGQ